MTSEMKPYTIPFEGFDKSRGFTSEDVHNAAQELREQGKGNVDPYYPSSDDQ